MTQTEDVLTTVKILQEPGVSDEKIEINTVCKRVPKREVLFQT